MAQEQTSNVNLLNPERATPVSRMKENPLLPRMNPLHTFSSFGKGNGYQTLLGHYSDMKTQPFYVVQESFFSSLVISSPKRERITAKISLQRFEGTNLVPISTINLERFLLNPVLVLNPSENKRDKEGRAHWALNRNLLVRGDCLAISVETEDDVELNLTIYLR